MDTPKLLEEIKETKYDLLTKFINYGDILTAREKQYIKNFQWNIWCKVVNEFLRNSSFNTYISKLELNNINSTNKEYMLYTFFKVLYGSLLKAPRLSKPLILLRGIKKHYLSTEPSKIFTINSFISTTVNIDTALIFSAMPYPYTNSNEYNNKIYVFYVNPECNYAYIPIINMKYKNSNIDRLLNEELDEDEVILSPYNKFSYVKTEVIDYIEGLNDYEWPLTVYYYTVLPNEEIIPDNYDDFIKWRSDTNMKGGKTNIIKNTKLKTLKNIRKHIKNNTRKHIKKNIKENNTQNNISRFIEPLYMSNIRPLTQAEKSEKDILIKYYL